MAVVFKISKTLPPAVNIKNLLYVFEFINLKIS